MLATSHHTFLWASNHYGPEDLESMRQAFQQACTENPDRTATEDQRSRLAKAIVEIYQPYLTQADLITAALNLKKVK